MADRRAPLVLAAQQMDMLRAMQRSKETVDHDAQATFQRLGPQLAALFVKDGSPLAEVVGYERSSLLENPDGHACVTVSVTNVGRYTGKCIEQAIGLTRCGDNYEAGLDPSRRETHNTITFMCPLPQRSYDAKFEVAGTGGLAASIQPVDKRGWLRRFLEDTCTVWACFVLLLKMIIVTFICHRFFDRTVMENLSLGHEMGGYVTTAIRWFGSQV